MTLEWSKPNGPPPFRDPDTFFRLNVMQRFNEADLGLTDPLGQPITGADYDKIWWMVIIELAPTRDGSARTSLDQIPLLAEDVQTGLASHILIPGEYTPYARQSGLLNFATIFAQRPYLELAIKPDGAERLGLDSVILGGPIRADTLGNWSEPFLPDLPPIDVPSESSVVAIIDNGIAIGHDLFRRFDGGELSASRVDLFWNMDARPDPNATIPSSIGRVWTRGEIENAQQRHLQNGLLNEAEFYRELGLIDWDRNRYSACAQRVSHGTHVAGLAAGYPASDDTGELRRIIAIQLPTRDIRQTDGTDLVVPLEQSLTFIREQFARYNVAGSDELPPLVMNFSFGNFAGPHDGTGRIDRMIDSAIDQIGTDLKVSNLFLLPSGNGNLAQCHASFELTSEKKQETLSWQLQPADRSMSILEAWLPHMPGIPDAAVTLTVSTPGANGTAQITAGPDLDFAILSDNGKIAALAVYVPPEAPTFRGQFVVFAVPTEHPSVPLFLAPSGAWTLNFSKGPDAEDISMEIWIRRDESLPGFPEFGRQSYFNDPRYDRLAPVSGRPVQDDKSSHVVPVRRSGTISGFACGDLPAVIAGFVRSDERMARYSAGGPTANIAQRPFGPDASTVSDDSVTLAGVLSAGSCSGSMVALAGTSVASPQVARKVAELMPQIGPVTRFDITQMAFGADPPSSSKPPPRRTGGGRLNFGSVFGVNRWPGQ